MDVDWMDRSIQSYYNSASCVPALGAALVIDRAHERE